jgi:hypothetical protein
VYLAASIESFHGDVIATFKRNISESKAFSKAIEANA